MNDKFFRDAAKIMDDAFKQMDKTQIPSSEPQDPNHIRINFRNRRWATFWKFLCCAIDILLTGETTLVVKKR